MIFPIIVYSLAARRSMVTATTDLTYSDMEQRGCRFKRKVFILTVIVSGFMCYTLYSISCCEMISRTDALTGRRYIQIYERGDEDNVYRATVRRSRPGFHFFGKNLLEDSPAFRDKYRDRYVRASDDGNNFDIEERDDELDEEEDSDEDRAEWNNPYAGHMSGNTYHKAINATRKLPQAIIIGVKKGGTRALLEFIRLHPDVRAVGPETHFFDRHYDRGLLWYRNQMPSTLEGQITMEKTPSYFVTREVPRRVFNMSKDVRLVVVVRDPVTRAISDYTQTVSKKHGMKSFEELAFLNNTTGLVDTTWGAIRIGVYAKHLERWLQYFPINQMLFVSGELLIKDPAGELAKVQDFLSLKRVVNEKHFYFNETKGFPCLKKPEGSSSPHCLGKTKGRQHPKIDPYAIHRLREFYRPFNMKFYQMTNQNFGWA